MERLSDNAHHASRCDSLVSVVESADLWEVDHASEFSHEWIYILSGRGISEIDDAEQS